MNQAVTVTPRDLIGLRGAGERLSLPVARVRAGRSGGYRSPFRGRGMEYEESRRYQAGDDIRNMDWRVTARTGAPHTKLYREERERPLLFGMDFRRSMFFATRGAFKSVVACRIAALLAWHGSHQGDRVGGVLWSGAGHREMRPRRGPRGVLGLVSALCAFAARPDGDNGESAGMEPLAARLRRVAHPGSLVFVLSDFRGFTRSVEDLLAPIGRHSTLVCCLIHDPIEAALPEPGRYLLRDGDRELVIDTRDRSRRARYEARFRARCEAVENFCRRTSGRSLLCPTDTDPVSLLRTRLGA
ncbi:MAG: DUF58 domain-containing protein [Gammaproteobacteria bacterium]|nr:DUF58 domain-containing protein [Gammaproteobacteria bacterium]